MEAPFRHPRASALNNMARLLFAPLGLLLLALPVRAQTAADFERLFGRALELHQAGDLLGAVESYKAALAIAPDRADALSNLGAAYVRLGQYDDGIKQYQAAIKVDPANSTFRLNLALAYYKSARPNEAALHLKRVVASEPEAKNAYLVLADCYLQTGQDQEVIALLKPRAAMFDNDLAYAFLLGTALLHTGDETEGQKYVERVFGAGESAEAHLLMGIAHLGQQDYPAAKTELERAVKLNPRVPTAHSLYGRALLALGEQADAERAFHQELDVNVNDFEANLQLGNMRRSGQRFPEASLYLERATTIRPGDLTARKLLASLRLQTGKVEEAVGMLEALAKDAPDAIEVHVQLATAYNRLGRKDDAQRERAIVDRLNAELQAKQRGK
jgi:tetratricopeptide (TPR) repeat protein